MADEADQAQDYTDRLIEAGLANVRARIETAPLQLLCEECDDAPREILGNGMPSRYCRQCAQDLKDLGIIH